MPDDNRMYPKQPLPTAIDRGLSRPYDSADRQRVRMGRDPLSRVKEDFSISQALERGWTPRQVARGKQQTLGAAIGDEGAFRRPLSRKQRREARSRR